MGSYSSQFRYGIEFEFGLVQNGAFVDSSNHNFDRLQRDLIEPLPIYEHDYPGLRIGDLGIKSKRWYIEGFERFDTEGTYLDTKIKGPEIRTPICQSIEEAVSTLKLDFKLFREQAARHGYRPVAVGLNPFQKEFRPDPPLNSWERAHRESPEEQTAYIHMLTYGPDVSLSSPDWDDLAVIDAAKKLTFYSPAIAAFAFSSPFREGKPWGGLSARTYYRNGRRPAALAFVAPKNVQPSRPTLTERARIPAERGRLEYKAFDSVPSLALYGSYLALIKGLALDSTLSGRSMIPDVKAHQQAAKTGFTDPGLRELASRILKAAHTALPSHEQAYLQPLEEMLKLRRSPANTLEEIYKDHNDIIKALEDPRWQIQ